MGPYNFPVQFALLDELPKPARGKIQRGGLAQQWGWTLPAAAAPAGFEVPDTPIEKALARLWSEILNRPLDQISLNDRFTELGGTSLNATQLVLKTRATFNVPVTILDFFNASTITLQAAVIEEIIQNPRSGRQNTDLIPIQPIGLRPPLFCTHAIYGSVYIYHNLYPFLPVDQPDFG